MFSRKIIDYVLIVVGGALAAVGIVAILRGPTSSSQHIFFESESIDLGQIPAGLELSQNLVLRNETDLDASIEVVSASCGCVKAAFTSKTLRAGMDLTGSHRPNKLRLGRQC